jgi:hypothetical protein
MPGRPPHADDDRDLPEVMETLQKDPPLLLSNAEILPLLRAPEHVLDATAGARDVLQNATTADIAEYAIFCYPDETFATFAKLYSLSLWSCTYLTGTVSMRLTCEDPAVKVRNRRLTPLPLHRLWSLGSKDFESTSYALHPALWEGKLLSKSPSRRRARRWRGSGVRRRFRTLTAGSSQVSRMLTVPVRYVQDQRDSEYSLAKVVNVSSG